MQSCAKVNQNLKNKLIHWVITMNVKMKVWKYKLIFPNDIAKEKILNIKMVKNLTCLRHFQSNV